MIKGSIQEEYTTLVNIYAPKTGAPKHIKQILTDIKGETESNTITVGDFNTPLTSVDRSSRQTINKATVVINDTLDQLELIYIYIYRERERERERDKEREREHSIPKHQNTCYFQVHMECSPG